jgi:dynein heavy chain
LTSLKNLYDASVNEKKELIKKMEETRQRLGRASKLTVALKDEEVRWTESVEILTVQMDDLVGNIFVSAACMAYFGAFNSSYREKLIKEWILLCEAKAIPVSKDFSLVKVSGDQVQIRDWLIMGLPSDSFSVENGILVTQGRRWPLMIDPQGQANKWIKQMEGQNLKVVKQTDKNFLRVIENAVRTGQPILIEDVGEVLDPSIDPLLNKQIVRTNGRLMVRLGDVLVDYDKNFRMYMTSKLPNPHYLPEVCIKSTIINFTVTKVGLEGQLLGDVVKLERPDLEEQKDKLVMNLSKDKKMLKDIEEKILKLLYNAKGNILDDEEMIQVLNQSKVTCADIQNRVKLTEETEIQINNAREKYLPIAKRGSILYFTITSLSEIDTMYQFSLNYFKKLFVGCIEKTSKSEDLRQRITDLVSRITKDTFGNISRGLFEKDKLVFTFMACCEILAADDRISPVEWNFFLRNGDGTSERPEWITNSIWTKLKGISQLPSFEWILKTRTTTDDWESFGSNSNFEFPNVILTGFQRLMLVKVLNQENLIPLAVEFIKKNLGPEYLDFSSANLASAFEDCSFSTPLVFILSPGSDPMSALMKFVEEKNCQDKLQSISLGQGQGPIAEDLIKKGLLTGGWVFLQNCHLSTSWMPRLEVILKELSLAAEKENGIDNVNGVHVASLKRDFRLFLSSMPSKTLPVAILQDSIKITNESPRGIRANMMKTFSEIKPDLYQGSPFRKLLFGVCFFNALIHERKKFGPIGWNINYDWSSSDLEVSIKILQTYFTDPIPWDALLYLTAEITFGGRVTGKKC